MKRIMPKRVLFLWLLIVIGVFRGMLWETPVGFPSAGKKSVLQEQREKFSIFLEHFPRGGVLKALILGSKEGISKKEYQEFIRSGLIHVLVISGQNVGLLLLCVTWLFYIIFLRFEFMLLYFNIQKILIGFLGCLIFVFYFFSGAAIPILRASIMAGCFLMALFASRPKNGVYSICWALALILNFIPSSLKDPSFQLSFAAIVGLMGLTVLFPTRSMKFFFVLSPLAAMVMTAPIIAYHFHRLSLISLISNMVVVPYVSFILLPASFIITGAYFIWEPLAGFFMIPFYYLANLFMWAAHVFGSFSWSSVYVSLPNFFQIFLYYGFLFFIFYFVCQKAYQKAFLNFLIMLLMLNVYGFGKDFMRRHDPHLRISFLDVGQGDSSVIEFPRGKTMLIDAGGIWGAFDPGEKMVAPFLWKQGIRHIDYLVLSHSDFDHIEGFKFILEHFWVGEIWLSQWESHTQMFYEILSVAEQKQIPCYLLSQNTKSLIINGAEIRFLNPTTPFERVSSNNRALVLKITHQTVSVLFTGDIEKSIEEKLLEQDLKSTVLKVPHHGSKTSSSYAFLKAVSPTLAVMSLGYRNRYHFPHAQVLKRYERLHIPLWRTDQQGTLCIKY